MAAHIQIAYKHYLCPFSIGSALNKAGQHIRIAYINPVSYTHLDVYKRQTGHIIKNVDENGNKRYDFQFENKRGYKVTIEGLSEKFNKEYWNYTKLISGVLRYRMPIELSLIHISSARKSPCLQASTTPPETVAW